MYLAMKEAPLKDDWINLVRKDMANMDLRLTNNQISILTKKEFKSIIKNKIRHYTFVDLEKIKAGHSKVRDILHCDLKKTPIIFSEPNF